MKRRSLGMGDRAWRWLLVLFWLPLWLSVIACEARSGFETSSLPSLTGSRLVPTATPPPPLSEPIAPGDGDFPLRSTSGITADTHVVQPGDTLFEIAQRYGVTVNDLVQANGIDDPRTLRVGQVLIIPRPDFDGKRP